MLLAVPHDALQGRVVLFSDKTTHEKVKAEQLKTNISSHIYVVYLYNHNYRRTNKCCILSIHFSSTCALLLFLFAVGLRAFCCDKPRHFQHH